jgi:hypothetical protein
MPAGKFSEPLSLNEVSGSARAINSGKLNPEKVVLSKTSCVLLQNPAHPHPDFAAQAIYARTTTSFGLVFFVLAHRNPGPAASHGHRRRNLR